MIVYRYNFAQIGRSSWQRASPGGGQLGGLCDEPRVEYRLCAGIRQYLAGFGPRVAGLWLPDCALEIYKQGTKADVGANLSHQKG
jgi:hypothetical protein